MSPLQLFAGTDGRGHSLPNMDFQSGMGKGNNAMGGEGGQAGDAALRAAMFGAAAWALKPVGKMISNTAGKAWNGAKFAARHPIQAAKNVAQAVHDLPSNIKSKADDIAEGIGKRVSQIKAAPGQIKDIITGKVSRLAVDTKSATTAISKGAQEVLEDTKAVASKLGSNAVKAADDVAKAGANVAKGIAPHLDDAAAIGGKAAGAAKVASGLLGKVPIIGMSIEMLRNSEDPTKFGKHGAESYAKGETGLKEVWAHTKDAASTRWDETTVSAAKTAESYQKGHFWGTVGNAAMTGLGALDTVASPLAGIAVTAKRGAGTIGGWVGEAWGNTFGEKTSRAIPLEERNARAAELAGRSNLPTTSAPAKTKEAAQQL